MEEILHTLPLAPKRPTPLSIPEIDQCLGGRVAELILLNGDIAEKLLFLKGLLLDLKSLLEVVS